LVVVHFYFPILVDISKDFDMAWLMPYLEEAAAAILAIAPLGAVLHGPSLDREG
jgi:hypothetical protein